MKKQLLLCLSMCLLIATTTLAKTLQARFSYCTFYAPGTGPYAETYLNVSGASVNYATLKNGSFQASVEISIIYQQGEKIKYFDKYNLLSPETNDTINALNNFTDQKRVSLPNGEYQLIISIRDKNNADAKPFELKQDLSLSYLSNVIAISDVQLLSSFKASNSEGPLYKNGYELEPFVDNFYPKENNSLKFYAEIYNTNAILGKEQFLLNYHIETFEQKKRLENYTSITRQTSSPVCILMTDVDISGLPSGNYNLVIEAKNRNNELLAVKEVFFQRSQGLHLSESGSGDTKNNNLTNTFVAQIDNRDSLAEYIQCLWPISSPNENTFAMHQLELADLNLMQQFFYDFWQKRNPTNPKLAWTEYKIEVDKVNNEYRAGNKKGYLTDRGRVYLQYGPPNQISKSYDEPNSYPYEIWHYYKAKTESNRKFVFSNVELATNDFKLLHSDAKGEVNERQWQLLLKKRNNITKDIDIEKPNNMNGFGNNSNDIFNNPR